VARSIFSVILPAWQRIIQIERFYGDLSPVTKTYLVLHVKCPIFLPDINKIWFFVTVFFTKSSRYQISRKYAQWKPRWYLRTDGRVDMDESNRRLFCNYANARKK